MPIGISGRTSTWPIIELIVATPFPGKLCQKSIGLCSSFSSPTDWRNPGRMARDAWAQEAQEWPRHRGVRPAWPSPLCDKLGWKRAAVLGIATNGQPIVNPVKQQRRASAVTPPPSAFAELGDRTASSRRCVDDFAQPRDLDTGASTLSRTRSRHTGQRELRQLDEVGTRTVWPFLKTTGLSVAESRCNNGIFALKYHDACYLLNIYWAAITVKFRRS